MANRDQPSGFRPYGELKRANQYVAGARCFPGDCVQLQSDGKVDPAAAGATIFGVALTYADADLSNVLVSDDPDQRYVGQADEADLDAQTDVGNVCDILATAGSTAYNKSRHEIDSSTVASGSSAQMLILGIESRPDNALGSVVDVIVQISEHQLLGQDAANGV